MRIESNGAMKSHDRLFITAWNSVRQWNE